MPAAPRMYLIVVCRPLHAALLVVRCMYMVVVPGLMLLGFRADLVYAEATAAFAKGPRESAVLFRNFLPRIARPSFRTQAPLFPVIVGRRRNRSLRRFNNPRG
jgi:hypothetical protein